MNKKLLSLLLVVCMLVNVLPLQVLATAIHQAQLIDEPVEQLTFSDVNKDNWFYDAVSYAYTHGLFNGTGENTFSPYGTMTRAMYVTVIGRMVAVDISKYQNKPTFSDVESGTYYAPYIAWAVEHGIVKGKEPSLFAPNEPLNREQMATLTVRLFDAFAYKYPQENIKSSPKDLDNISDYARESVLKLWTCGMFKGDDLGKFNPKNKATRAECATFLMRTDEHLVEIGAKEYQIGKEEKPAIKPEVTPEVDPDVTPTNPPTSDSNTYTVTFQDGDRYVDKFSVVPNKPLDTLPAANKIAKENVIFVGWFADKALTIPFYQDNLVTKNMTVYAKYMDLPGETLTLSSFTQLDQNPDLSFHIVKTAEAGTSPDKAFTLVPKDGSDPIPLKWKMNGDVYTVTAMEGYNKGCSYELLLAEGYIFKDKPDTIRTASFTIKMDDVANLQMNDDIVYIKDTTEINYDIDGTIYEVLTPSLVPETGGTFTYIGSGGLKKNDILCFYINTSPKDRDYINNSYNDDPEVYAKVENISGTMIIFGALGDADMETLYNVPDNFPIIVPQLPTGNTGTINIDDLDIDTYALIMGNEDGTLDNAKEKISVGDFISLYVSANSVTSEGQDAVYFGEVTAYDKSNGTITYKETTSQAIEDSMDLYINPEVKGDDLITPEQKAIIEPQLLAQVQASNFASDAAFMLADMASKTNGFRNIDGVQKVFFRDENGNPISEEKVALLNLGGSFELYDDVKLTVELVTKGDQLHFKNGVQLAIGIDASFKVETADEGNIVIDISAVFVEEVALGVNVKGDLVWKKVLGFIPIPIGVSVSTALDIKNFSAVSFNINIYTVGPEEESLWEKVKDLLGDNKVGKLLDQIEDIQNKIDQAKGTAEQIKGYAKDLEDLWKAMPQDGTNKEEWAQLGKALGKTNITKDLMDMLNLTTRTSLESGIYAKSMQDLMEKYSEMIQKETDWVKLVDYEMFGREICCYGVAIKANVNFVVRADINIAAGTSLEYEVGKRYTFWFKIGLFKPKAGSETMDLIDEHFAFQFYVMGKMGLKMGVAATIRVGIGSTEFASIGITAELGPYIKLYGFFIYEYEKMRPANTSNWIYKERMAGALYLEFGLYFILTFDAHAIGKLFEYSHDFFNLEIPLLKAGEKRYQYAFAYKPQEDEKVRIVDEDSNSTNGITMNLPDNLRALSYIDLTNGVLASEPYGYEKYNINFSNPNFSIDKNGKVFVNVPKGVQYMECDLTLTWLNAKLAFSQYDMTVTIPLVWTNLSSAELNEYFTASVRVGNDMDGYQTIWNQRIKKNQEFDLPTMEKVKKLINYDNYDNGSGANMKYASISDYGSQDTKKLKIYDDTVYDIKAAYKDYSVTVSGIHQSDGSLSTKTYTTKHGKAFDFTDLRKTGTNKLGQNIEDTMFTRFATLTAEKPQADMENSQISTYDLTSSVEGKYALAITEGKVNPLAIYVDDGVLATFQFDGISHQDIIQKLRKGTEPDLWQIEEIVSAQGLAIKDITPTFGKLFTNTIYTVICGELTGSHVTIFFDENGGSDLGDITKVEGSLIGTLPTPTKEGYTFAGWYSDIDLSTAFTLGKMPSKNITLYAKWMANTYTVTLDAQGGTFDEDINQKQIEVTYGSTYGLLEIPKYSGKYFVGWFTAPQDGIKINADTNVEIANNHTLYGIWGDLQTINEDVFTFTPVYKTYEKSTEVSAVYEKSDEYAEIDGFTFEYRKQGAPNTTISVPMDAGTYDMIVKKTKDNKYAQFEYRYTAVVVITKATRTIDRVSLEVNRAGYTFLDLEAVGDEIDDLSSEAIFTFKVNLGGQLVSRSTSGESYVNGLLPDTQYDITVEITGDPNYEDAISKDSVVISTLEAPTTSWSDNTEEFEVSDNLVTITTAGQLALLAKEIYDDKFDSRGVTITLANDIDLTGHNWIPIGSYPNNYFAGTFDGDNHTISGLYTAGDIAVGLFGCILNATVKNVRLDESYIEGISHVGGIVGFSRSSLIQDCINGATIKAYSNVGGIAGSNGNIILLSENTNIINCVNFGSITGDSNVGGVVGLNDDKNSYVQNCYNIGTVKGTGEYIGSVVGRNTKDNGKVLQCYYLYGSATRNGVIRNAVGTEKGSLKDGEVNTQTAFFTSPESNLSRDCGYGTEDLISALNQWIREDTKYNSSYWVIGTNGYPVPQ